MKRSADLITADDVAALAGVSRWTVSRAFKKNASISVKSREKVLKAAEELNYWPDLLATSLATDRTNLVALLVDDFANPHKLIMMERLTRVLRKNGYDTLLVNTEGEEDASAALLNASQRRVDAAVLIGVTFSDHSLETALGARRVKKLIVFARMSNSSDTISICCDDEAAMIEVADHVFSAGFRDPYFVSGPQTQSAHLRRKEAFFSHWQAISGKTPKVISVGSYDPILAYSVVAETFRGLVRSNLPDVLVCENDALAIGAIDALRYEVNLRVPEDIAVTGFDDVPQARNPQYQLTTYRQPITDMAKALVNILEGNVRPSKRFIFKGQLITRKST